MTIHLLRMAVRVENIAHLKQIQNERLQKRVTKGEARLYTFSRNIPKRVDDLIDGGSIYWIIKKYIRVRQRILGFERHTNEEGRRYCAIQIDPELVQVVPRRHKAFQGWRYQKPEDAPLDVGPSQIQVTDIPAEMANELRELGLI